MPSGGTFKQKATLAEVSGRVTSVKKNPLGGWLVTIQPDKGKPVEHFVRPDVKPTVQEGDVVERGDLISSGYAHPYEVLKLKGLEKGRQYLAQALWNIYQSQGIDIHPKHFEAVVKALTNYARIVDPRDTEFVEGEVVDLPALEKHLSQKAQKKKKHEAVGKYAARSYGFLLPGQKIERQHLDQLPDEVEVVDSAPEVEPYITSITKLHHHVPDTLVGLSRAELKKVLLDSVWYGKTSNLNWYHPVPKWVFGTFTDQALEQTKQEKRSPGVI
jgi:DNA-directed RNA polymerase subunit beta'